jgi:O-antigen/teichoic acid export membrane protein
MPSLLKKNHLVMLAGILLSLQANPALASYSDGFFGLVILFYSVPVMVIGLVLSSVFTAFSAFKKPKVFKGYVGVWVAVATVATLVASSMSIEGSDGASPVLIFIGFAIYLLIILSPAIVQYRLSKREQAEQDSTDD